MFSKKEKYLIRDKLHKSVHIKYKYKLKLGKSMLRNNLILKNKKLYIKLKLMGSLLMLRKKNICLLSGENNSIKKNTLTSRFTLNSLCISNKLQNFKVNT
jgi:hypothetical protein